MIDKTSKYRNFEQICENCGCNYVSKSHAKIGESRFCGIVCRNKWCCKNKNVKKICVICNNEYLVDFKTQHKSVTCSLKCYEKHRGNRIIGSCSFCSKNVFGRQTVNRRADFMFCSKICCGKYSAKNNEPNCYQKKKIWNLVKDGLKVCCEKCGIEDLHILTVHHVDFNNKNNLNSNLMLLCYNCHFKIHHMNTSRIEDYIKKIKILWHH